MAALYSCGRLSVELNLAWKTTQCR